MRAPRSASGGSLPAAALTNQPSVSPFLDEETDIVQPAHVAIVLLQKTLFWMGKYLGGFSTSRSGVLLALVIRKPRQS